MDAEHDRAAALLPRLERMAEEAQSLAALQRQHQQACTGTIQVEGVDRAGNRAIGSINRAETPECISEAAELSSRQAILTKEGIAVQEAARTSGVLPGLLRNLVATYHLEQYLNP
jgi:hypothetical protein